MHSSSFQSVADQLGIQISHLDSREAALVVLRGSGYLITDDTRSMDISLLVNQAIHRGGFVIEQERRASEQHRQRHDFGTAPCGCGGGGGAAADPENEARARMQRDSRMSHLGASEVAGLATHPHREVAPRVAIPHREPDAPRVATVLDDSEFRARERQLADSRNAHRAKDGGGV